MPKDMELMVGEIYVTYFTLAIMLDKDKDELIGDMSKAL